MKYGLKFVNIHGIGSYNVKTVRDTISELEKSEKFKGIKTETKKDKRIFVRIEFEE